MFSTLVLLFFTTNLNAQIKVWSNNHVSIGSAITSFSQQLTIWGDSYQTANGSTSGFYIENYQNVGAGGVTFNEPILKPQFGMAMWLGNSSFQLYRVYSRRVYTSDGLYTFSDRRLKINIVLWNESALAKLMRLNVYRYDIDPTKFGEIPEGKDSLLTEESKNKIGFMAQEVQEVFPEMVTVASNEEGYLAVNYTMMIPVLIEAMKEQQKLILELLAKVEALEAK